MYQIPIKVEKRESVKIDPSTIAASAGIEKYSVEKVRIFHY